MFSLMSGILILAADIMKCFNCPKKDFGKHISYSEVYFRKWMTNTSLKEFIKRTFEKYGNSNG